MIHHKTSDVASTIQNPKADFSATSVLVVPSAIIVTVTLASPIGEEELVIIDVEVSGALVALLNREEAKTVVFRVVV